jgi:hypothetical protein
MRPLTRFFAAVPLDVRKGCAFPGAAVLDLWGYAPNNFRSGVPASFNRGAAPSESKYT